MNQRYIVMFPVATGQGRMDKLEGDKIHQILLMYEDIHKYEYIYLCMNTSQNTTYYSFRCYYYNSKILSLTLSPWCFMVNRFFNILT